MGIEEKPVFKMKAVKELKILDAKQAQNICEYKNVHCILASVKLCTLKQTHP